MYGMPKSFLPSDNLILPLDYQTLLPSTNLRRDRIPMFGSHELVSRPTSSMSQAEPPSTTLDFSLPEEDVLSVTKAKIVSHPIYPRLLHAYIDCQKVIPNPLFLSLNFNCVASNYCDLLPFKYFRLFIFKFRLFCQILDCLKTTNK